MVHVKELGTRRSIGLALDEVEPGTKGCGKRFVGTMASGQEICIPFLIARGTAPGPCLWVNAAVHGDELNGVLASIDFFRAIDSTALAGTIVLTPVSNPLALDARRKRVPQDELDLDQSFPGRPTGSTTEILAGALFSEIAGRADVLVSFHAMMPYFSSIPYAVYKCDDKASVTEACLLGYIASFDPFVACRMPIQGTGSELPGDHSRSLDYQCMQLGKPAFMIELGAGSRQEAEPVRQGVAGLLKLAANMGLLREGQQDRPPPLTRVTRRTHVFARSGGFFRQFGSPGKLLPRTELLGHIEDYAGRVVEEIAFDRDTLVIGVRSDPVVHSGDRVGFVALEWASAHAECRDPG